MVIYSHSRLSSFEQCKLKFKFKYLDKLEPDMKQTIEGFLGNMVHDTLEWLYTEIQKGNLPELDDLINYYTTNWSKEYSTDIKVIKIEFTQNDYFNKGIKFLISYYQKHTPFKDNTIATEKRITVNLDSSGNYKLQGYIDRLVHDKKTNIFEIHDYKTGGSLKPQNELDKDRQLALYSIGLREMFNEVTDVKLIWHYLAFDKKLTSSRTTTELETLKKDTKKLIDEIESCKEFKPNPSILCRWCEFRSYCPLFNGHKEISSKNNSLDIYHESKDNSNNTSKPKSIHSKWSLFEGDKKLEPLLFSNNKTQEDVVNEVIDAINDGNKLIFINGKCGTGKSAIALNLAKHFDKTSIIVPIKSLQEQYSKDYTDKKYVMQGEKKLKISTIVGRNNFECQYLKENEIKDDHIKKFQKEKDTKLGDIFPGKPIIIEKDTSADNKFLPCKIEIKEKNLTRIKEYVNSNPHVKMTDFTSINEVKRMTIAPICKYWSPIIPKELEIKRFDDANKISYMGLNDKEFTIYQRKPGCGYYDQYSSYKDADVIIFNSLKYKLETLMDRKPLTQIEIIDECDDFLDSFANQEKLSFNRLTFSTNTLMTQKESEINFINSLTDLSNAIKIKYSEEIKNSNQEIIHIKETLVEELLELIQSNLSLIDSMDLEESNYIYTLAEISMSFSEFLDETYFTIEQLDKDILLTLVTPNLAKRLDELIKKNNVIVMMSGTLHSESVLRDIFGLKDFIIIDAETQHLGKLIKLKNGYESNCKYENFKSGKVTREKYLKALSKAVSSAIPPTLVHLTSFKDLPSDFEKQKFDLVNLPSEYDFTELQKNDPLGKRVEEFKNKKTNILFTTRCNRGIDFPGDTCNSIIVTRFPYPNISSLFWRILKKTKPQFFNSFYMDKAHRDFLQKIYRGLRSKDDKIYLLSPDERVFNYEIV